MALAGSLWVGGNRIGQVPPIGGLLEPAHGIWALATHATFPEHAATSIPTLASPVDVRYDDRGVPHIFAANELDATRALGYVVARDRLFQLELQTRAASGTLTELVGSRALDADRTARRIGLPWGAERKFAAIAPGSMAMRMMRAYADGVNAYIDQMGAADLPLEYRLLGKKPARWKPENTMLLLVRMGYTLAWSDLEVRRPQIEARIGRPATDALFPPHAYIQEPIRPNGLPEPRVESVAFPAPHPDSAAATFANTLAAITRAIAPADIEPVARDIGSNNWAVSPKRSADGHALLANDPHLDLTLPSTWYEAHIVVPDSLDVYGVTFPGAPSIVLGLNRDVAWGSTNTGADVADYYLETVDDSVAPAKYKLDGAWRPVVRSVQTYRNGLGATIATDTLYYTHRGPLFRVGDRWISRRWLTLEPSADFDAFRLAPRAHSVREFFVAMTHFESPAQNFIAADRDGHIGIRSNGRLPIRPGDGLGNHFFDGTLSASDWRGWIPADSTPQSIDPPQGYLASANQEPADPRTYAPYVAGEWTTPWRAMRINKLLRTDSAVTPEAMRLFQTDPGNARADAFAPMFLDAAHAELARHPGDSTLARATSLLGDWNRRYTPDNERAVLFEEAMRQLTRMTWDELSLDPPNGGEVPERLLATPEEHVLYALTRDPTNIWWDRKGTAQRETRDDVLAAALRAALVRVEAERGPVSAGRWRWSRVRFANIWSPLHIEALSALNLSVQGGRESLNPSSGNGTHGPSWRLVADLGPTIRAWGIYPGGQSANPVSPHYRDRIESWRRGELDSLRIPSAPDSLQPQHFAAQLTLTPPR